MSTLASRGYGDATTRAAFVARCAGSHAVEWSVDIVRWDEGGDDETLATDVPIVDGVLILDSSDLIRRRLTIELGGGEAWAPVDTDSPLVPFGQRLILKCRIDDGLGGWLPWLKQGEFWIVSNVFERPSLITTVDAVDYSGAVEEFGHLNFTAYKGLTVEDAVVRMVRAALPGGAWGSPIVTTDRASDKVVNYQAKPGQGRWSAAIELAGKHAVDPLFDANGHLVLRKQLTDDDEVSGAGGDGPDIGDKTHPVATITDGSGGSLIAMTSTLTREGSCNGVRVNLHYTVKKKDRKGKSSSTEVTWSHDELVDSGPVEWGGSFGKVPIVLDDNVAKITADIKSARVERARRVLRRRRGLVRYHDVDAAPLYWIEPDDFVRLDWHTTDGALVSEDHYVQRVEFPLAGGPMRVRTRQLSVINL